MTIKVAVLIMGSVLTIAMLPPGPPTAMAESAAQDLRAVPSKIEANTNAKRKAPRRKGKRVRTQ